MSELKPEVLQAVRQHIDDSKREMERSIKTAVIDAVDQFQRQTGLCPSALTINLVDVTVCGDGRQRFVVAEVEAKVEL